MLSEDLAERVSSLLEQRPLPADADAQLAALIAEAPVELQPTLERDLSEALITAREAQSFTGLGNETLTFG